MTKTAKITTTTFTKILTKEKRNIRVTVIITTVEVIYIQHDTQIKRYKLGTDTYINIYTNHTNIC